jgi:selenocysteine-specific elongation factor
MRVIGSAGHVDHGKSTLIAALTGTHPDRLKEEQARAMTIDLGFAWFTLPGEAGGPAEEIGIVDVPGHRDFIENMLAGVGGLDAGLLVIAADEGIMPQTREHLAILDLLEIPAGLIVVTKIDLVEEPTWLDLIEAEIRKSVAATVFKDAPIVRVSARSGTGLEELKRSLRQVLEAKPARADLGRPRLPIDRVFSMSGFGTVVTGTLLDGQLVLGDEIEILPSGRLGRIRGLQTHKQKEDTAIPGSRTAVNVAGLGTDEIGRGDTLARPGQYRPTRRLDVRLRLLPDATTGLAHSDQVKVFIGTQETLANARLLDADELQPGSQGWVQLDLRDAVVAVRGDHFILRRPSPGETLGGGSIVDPQPAGRHKRFDVALIASLEQLSQGSPADMLRESLRTLQMATRAELAERAHMKEAAAAEALNELLAAGEALILNPAAGAETKTALFTTRQHWNELARSAGQLLEKYHEEFPLRRGMPREELKSRLKLSGRVFNEAAARLGAEGAIVEDAGTVRLPGHAIRLSGAQQAKVAALLRKFAQAPYAPPGAAECETEVGLEVLKAVIEQGELIEVSPEVLFRKVDYDSMVLRIREALAQAGRITLAEVRDMFHTSRKYAQALLEHLDAIGLTAREGDYRKLRK